MTTPEIKAKVDEYAELSARQTRIKSRMDELKGFFESLATEDLKDTKLKTVAYWGSNNAKVVVGNSATVKPVSMTMVKELFGRLYDDFVKEETTYKMTEPCKRLLSLAFLGEYTEGSLDDVITQISGDDKIRQTLKKKLKGKFDRDKDTLMKLAGLSEQEASDWAYLAAEVINWEWLTQILAAARWDGTTEKAIEHIRTAIMVDEGIKVGIEIEN